jgi:hypothetical protein
MVEEKQILSTHHRHASPKIHEVKIDSRKKGVKIAPPLCTSLPKKTTLG